MIDTSGLQIVPPTDWPAFERIVRRLFAKIMNAPLAQVNGRTGQEQHGIDVFLHTDGRFIGIQCKLKDMLAADAALRRQQFRAEVLDARENFKPSVGHFILATTARNDAELQEYARRLTEEFGPDGIEVSFYGWHQLRVLIGEDQELREHVLGIEGVPALSEKVDRHQSELMDRFDRMEAAILTRPLETVDATSPLLKRMLDRIKSKMEQGQVREGLADLLSLRDDEWESASTQNRFSLLSAIGQAYWQLGEQAMAAPYFVDASALLPDHEKGLANKAASLAVTGDSESAREAALRLIELYPETELGVLALIQAQEVLEPLDDPRDVVPPEKRASEEAYIGAVQVYRNRGDEVWLSLAAKAAALYPDSRLLQGMQADSVLYRLAVLDGVHAGAKAESAPAWQEVEAAVATLQRHWDAHVAIGPSRVDEALAQNLAQLLRALDRIDEGIAVMDRAGPDTTPDGRGAHIHATLLARAGRGDEAQARLKARLDVVANRVLAAHLSTDPAEVLRIVEEGDWTGAAGDELMWRAILSAEARAELAPAYDPVPDLEAAAAAQPQRLVGLVALARRSERGPAGVALADRILAAVTPETTFSELMQAGQWLRSEGLAKHLVALLGGRVGVDLDSPGLRWLIEALLALDDRPALTALLDSLPEEIASKPRFLEYRAVSRFNRGDLPAARDAIERILATEPDRLRTRLLWAQILMRQEDRDPIGEWLDGPVERFEGSVDERAELGHLLVEFGQFDRARVYAYRVARSYPDSKVAQEKFMAVGLRDPRGIGMPKIGPDCVFVLVDAAGQRREYRLETEAGLPRDAIDLPLDAPIAKAATGLAEGDSFVMPSRLDGAPGHEFKVETVLHKHVHYLRMLADTLSTRFDGPVMLHKITVDPETGSGLEILSENVRLGAERAEAAFAAYDAAATPFRVLARLLGTDIIDCYDGIRAVRDARFIAEAQGDPDATLVVSRNQRRGCIVDALTLEIVRRLDLVSIVEALLGPMFVSQATLDLHNVRCERNREFDGLQHGGTLAHQDGRAILMPDYPVLRQAIADVRAQARRFVKEHTRVASSAGPAGLARRLREMLPEPAHDVLVDDILAATEAAIPLLSDDLGYRRLARECGALGALGLYPLLALAFSRGLIGHGEYVRKLSQLGEARHCFLPIDAGDLGASLSADGVVVGKTVVGMLHLLGGEGCDLRRHLAVAAAFLDQVWSDGARSPIRLQLIFLVADRLLGAGSVERSAFGEAAMRDPDGAVRLLRVHVIALDRARSNRAALGRR